MPVVLLASFFQHLHKGCHVNLATHTHGEDMQAHSHLMCSFSTTSDDLTTRQARLDAGSCHLSYTAHASSWHAFDNGPARHLHEPA